MEPPQPIPTRACIIWRERYIMRPKRLAMQESANGQHHHVYRRLLSKGLEIHKPLEKVAGRRGPCIR